MHQSITGPGRSPAMRTARIVLIVSLVGTIICASILFYFLGLSTRPHHLGVASLLAGFVVVGTGGGHVFVYRTNVKRIRTAVEAGP